MDGKRRFRARLVITLGGLLVSPMALGESGLPVSGTFAGEHGTATHPSGTVTGRLNPDTDVLSYRITYAHLSGPVTAAHFHGPAPRPVPMRASCSRSGRHTTAQSTDARC